MKQVRDFPRPGPPEEIHLGVDVEGKRSLGVKLGAVACAIILTLTLVGGFFFLRGRNAQTLRARQQAEQAAALANAPPPRAQVFQDEILLKGSKAVAGGSVRNISDARLEDLSVEIELKARNGRSTEKVAVGVEPASLGPGEEGRFALQFTPGDWGGTRVSRLLGAKGGAEIPFRSELGAKRPPERAPSPKVIVVPRPRTKGDDYLNTPDNPTRIP